MSGPPGLQERAGVLDLLAAVKYAKDDHDETRFKLCWAKDARLDITSGDKAIPPVEGREAIMAFYRSVWEAGGHGKGAMRETHIAEYPDIQMQHHGRLRARHAVSFFFADHGEPRLRGFGTFDDVIVFEDGKWCIAHRRATLVRRL